MRKHVVVCQIEGNEMQKQWVQDYANIYKVKMIEEILKELDISKEKKIEIIDNIIENVKKYQ